MLNSFLSALFNFGAKVAYPSGYNYTYNYPTVAVPDSATVLVGALTVLFVILIVLALVVFTVIGRWKIYQKAGEEGWKSLIPIYSDYTKFKILNMEPLLCIISNIPVSHFFLNLVSSIKLAKSFHKSTAFGIGLFLCPWIFELILGFGSAKYTKLPSSK